MSNYDETNRGAIWKNDKKASDTHPDFKGHLNVGGVEYWVSAWRRKDGDNPKSPALRFSIKAKDSRTESAGGGGQSRPSVNGDGGHRADDPPQSGGGDFDEDIPFNRLGPEYFV